MKQEKDKLVDIIKHAKEVLSDGGVVAGDSIVCGFVLGDVGIRQVDGEGQSLEDPVTISGEGVKLCNNFVVDVARHTLEVDRDPVNVEF